MQVTNRPQKSSIEPRPPTGFISHSECDDAFCHGLNDALCALGVRPVMDKRDFRLGDDFVKEIFDKGIGTSDAVIFVLSPGSVDRPWLREELSISVVEKLRRRTRLIPVVLTICRTAASLALSQRRIGFE